MPTKTPHKPKFPCKLRKGDHLIKDFHGLSQILEVWYNASQQAMLLAYGHHTGDAPRTSESLVKSIEGKVINHSLLCK